MIKKTAFGPASVANVAVGFDLLGFCLNDLGDTVTVTRLKEKTIRISKISVTGGMSADISETLPTDPAHNTATAGLLKMQNDLKLDFGFDVEIIKGIPLGSGLGGSSASAVAAVMAANATLDKPRTRGELLPFAVQGESVASGSHHADNVAPSLLGGLVLVSDTADAPVVLPIPTSLSVAVIHPGLRVDTRDARAVLPKNITFAAHKTFNSRLAQFLAGCYQNNVELIKANLRDEIVEPARKHLIPGFEVIQYAALRANAWGASIAGAGPSIFAWCDDNDAKNVMNAMLDASIKHGHKNSRGWFGKINTVGAKLI